MKKYFYLSLVMLAGVIMNTIKIYAQPYYGVRLSGGWANVYATGPYASLFNTKPTGYLSVGVFGEFALPKENLYVKPILMLSRKGFNWHFFSNFHFEFYYLEAPLTFEYHYDNFSFGAGPYLALGLTGWNKTTGEDPLGEPVDKKVKFYPLLGKPKDNNKNYFTMLDFGLNLGISYQIDSYRLGLYYSRGFRKLFPTEDEGNENEKTNTFHKVIYLSASYYFNL